MFYSKSKNSFYTPEVHGSNIPSDVIEITYDQWQTLLESQSQGQIIQANANGNPEAVSPPAPTQAQIIASYESAAQTNLDSVARSWGYSSLAIATSYVNSSNAQWKAEAEALIAWRDAYWTEAYTIEAGTLPATAQGFVALLPAAPTKPTA